VRSRASFIRARNRRPKLLRTGLFSEKIVKKPRGQRRLPIGGDKCWANIGVRRSEKSNVGPTKASADREGGFPARQSAPPIGKAKFPDDNAVRRSAERNVGRTKTSADREGGISGGKSGLPIGGDQCSPDNEPRRLENANTVSIKWLNRRLRTASFDRQAATTVDWFPTFSGLQAP
jgi:hypothetical protein